MVLECSLPWRIIGMCKFVCMMERAKSRNLEWLLFGIVHLHCVIEHSALPSLGRHISFGLPFWRQSEHMLQRWGVFFPRSTAASKPANIDTPRPSTPPSQMSVISIYGTRHTFMRSSRSRSCSRALSSLLEMCMFLVWDLGSPLISGWIPMHSPHIQLESLQMLRSRQRLLIFWLRWQVLLDPERPPRRRQ